MEFIKQVGDQTSQAQSKDPVRNTANSGTGGDTTASALPPRTWSQAQERPPNTPASPSDHEARGCCDDLACAANTGKDGGKHILEKYEADEDGKAGPSMAGALKSKIEEAKKYIVGAKEEEEEGEKGAVGGCQCGHGHGTGAEEGKGGVAQSQGHGKMFEEDAIVEDIDEGGEDASGDGQGKGVGEKKKQGKTSQQQ